MTPLPRFRQALTSRLGWAFDGSKDEWLSQVLKRRLAATHAEPDDYLTALEQLAPPDELRALAQELTIGETYFFRHLEQFRALISAVRPRENFQGTPRVRLLSVGCASGEEAYTLAIAVREWLGGSGWAFSIRAVDINRASLDRAAKARYGAWALRDTPQELRQRWFVRDGDHLTVKDEIRAAVKFEERNIAAPDQELWAEESYDAIFFRNVLMYFSPEVARTVVGRIASALAPGGHLFLGHAETLRGLSNDFHLCHTHETFYYQRKPATGAPISEPLPAPLPAPAPPPLDEGANTWVDSIRQASERVHALTSTPSVSTEARWDLVPVRRSLERERFDEAFELLQALPSESLADPETLLLFAVTQFQRGDLQETETACRSLLQRDELNAAAHYLLALCREGSRDEAGAGEEDRVASYLDPAFALPRMHLGMLARRSGDLVTARRELTQAVWLLHREELSRLMLFSGGFGRQALISVCQSELERCGGTS